jgi:hypothetical protein
VKQQKAPPPPRWCTGHASASHWHPHMFGRWPGAVRPGDAGVALAWPLAPAVRPSAGDRRHVVAMRPVVRAAWPLPPRAPRVPSDHASPHVLPGATGGVPHRVVATWDPLSRKAVKPLVSRWSGPTAATSADGSGVDERIGTARADGGIGPSSWLLPVGVRAPWLTSCVCVLTASCGGRWVSLPL